MRWIEWLFPNLRYIRLRREASCLRALTAAWVPLTVLLLILIWEPVLLRIQDAVAAQASGYGPPVTAATIGDIAGDFLDDLIAIIEVPAVLAIAYAIVSGLELALALIFVRTRPGRRRPLCTWRTIKHVQVNSAFWAWLLVFYVGLVRVLDRAPRVPRQYENLQIAGIIAVFIAAPVIFIGVTAVHAAGAVIALQDDRRCYHCGYFLINLPSNRCPECGREFDAEKVAAASGEDSAGAGVEGGAEKNVGKPLAGT